MSSITHPTRYRAILFDLDGTLLDTAPDFITALNNMLSGKNLAPIDPDVIRAGVTHGSAGLVTLGFGLKPEDSDFESTRQEFLVHYRNCLTQQTRLFPGMEAILARLAEREIPWGIVTNKPELYTMAILKNLWLPALPKAIICPDHVANTKPHPEPVLLACKELDIKPEETLVVGDHLRDIQSGRNAGCYTVSAAYGYIDADEDPSDWGAHYLINHASELNDIIFPQQTDKQ